MISSKDIEGLQQETGFDRDLLEKVIHLTSILSELVKNDTIAENLVLKGGTSLNLIHLDMPRLSIDLDFNYIGSLDREQMLKERKDIEKIIEKIGSDLGYEVEDRGSSYIISRKIFRYEKTTGIKDHVKIEINFLQRMPVGEVKRSEFKLVDPKIESFNVPIYSIEELCAQKMVACLDRYLFRDIYDVYIYSDLKLNMGLTKKFVAVYFCMNSDTKEVDLSFFNTVDPQELEQNLHQFVRDLSEKPEQIIHEARKIMEDMFCFSDECKAFVDEFYDNKRVDSKTLFPEGNDLSVHPSLLFRLSQLSG